MTVVERLVERIRACQKGNLPREMNLLKTVYGEIELARMRNPKKFTDQDAINVFKKFKLGVQECIEQLEKRCLCISDAMNREIKIYEEFIPETMSVDAIEIYLEKTMEEAISSAKSVGQATGISMGRLKKDGMPVDGKDVAEAVKRIYDK